MTDVARGARPRGRRGTSKEHKREKAANCQTCRTLVDSLWVLGSASLPANDVGEFTAWLKANPDKASFGTIGRFGSDFGKLLAKAQMPERAAVGRTVTSDDRSLRGALVFSRLFTLAIPASGLACQHAGGR
jgi:hypothetical protein